MHKITVIAFFVLAASLSACSGGGQTGFVDDIAILSESAADVPTSANVTEEDVVEAIKEDIAARDTDTDIPASTPEEIAGAPDKAEALPKATSGKLPEESDPATTPETPVDQTPDLGTALQPEDDATVSPPARATGTLTPSNPGQVLVGGEKEYTANYGLSATAEPYTPPVEYESPGFSATYTPHQPEPKRPTLNGSRNCLMSDCD